MRHCGVVGLDRHRWEVGTNARVPQNNIKYHLTLPYLYACDHVQVDVAQSMDMPSPSCAFRCRFELSSCVMTIPQHGGIERSSFSLRCSHRPCSSPRSTYTCSISSKD